METRVGTQIEMTAGLGSTSAQAKPPAHVELPMTQLSQQLAFAPLSNETQVPARPRTSAGQVPVVVQSTVQTRSPLPAARQLKLTGQSLLVKQKS